MNSVSLWMTKGVLQTRNTKKTSITFLLHIHVCGCIFIMNMFSFREKKLKYYNKYTTQKKKRLKFNRFFKSSCFTKTSVPHKTYIRTSLGAQRLRIRLPMQGTRVRALVQEDPTCCGAAGPMHHNY